MAWRATRYTGVFWIPLYVQDVDSGEAGAGAGERPAATVLIRMDPGCAYAPHRHLGTEDVLVLAGAYRDERGEYTQGEYVHYPAGSEHSPRALGDASHPRGPQNPACILYATAPGGIELLEG